MPSTILIADDQPDILQALRFLLKAEGFAVDTVSSPGGVLSAIERKDYDVGPAWTSTTLGTRRPDVRASIF